MLTKLNSFAKNKDNSYSNLIIFEIMNNIKIKSALISVFSKEGIAPIVDELVENKVKLYSGSGGEIDLLELEIRKYKGK